MKWKVVRQVLSKEQLIPMYGYCKEKAKEPTEFDEQIPGTPSFYNDAMMKYLSKRLLPIIEEEFQTELWNTYCFWRLYKTGDVLHIHTDRPSCEISTTIHLGHGGENWPIHLRDGDKEHVVILEPGDMLCYRGCDLPHWREEFKDGFQYAQVFLHYVDKNGPHKEWKFDKKEIY